MTSPESHRDGRELYISVDVETSGPIPGEYNLLSLGACRVGQADQYFYVEFKPITEGALADAMKVNQLSLAQLKVTGAEPRAAMEQFAAWIRQVAAGARPVFVGFNAAFDWSFVNYYFHKFLGDNPFGHTALDIKSYYMAARRTTWARTTKAALEAQFLSPDLPHTHNALGDAIEQGAIFEKLLRVTFGSEAQ